MSDPPETSKSNEDKPKGLKDLPKLPFDILLSHLSLEDKMMSMAATKGWRERFELATIRPKMLFCSSHSIGFIDGKRRLVSGAFADHFVSSPQYLSFFLIFRPTLLSELQHLRICDLPVSEKNRKVFVQILNSFSQLHQLDVIRVGNSPGHSPTRHSIKLNMPILSSVRLEEIHAYLLVTLDAPKLKRVCIKDCSDLKMRLGHPETVERLIIHRLKYTEVKKLKKLQYLNTHDSEFGPTFLSYFEHLKQIHLQTSRQSAFQHLFEQKALLNRDHLKIYLRGMLLSGHDDPAIDALQPYFGDSAIRFMVENASRVTEEIPFQSSLYYSDIQNVAPEQAIHTLKKLIDLKTLIVKSTVEDIAGFLRILKNIDIIRVEFWCAQPQELYDRMPENSAVQKLTIYDKAADFRFISKLKDLIYLELKCQIDAATIRQILEELKFLLDFEFMNKDRIVCIQIKEIREPKKFEVWVNGTTATVKNVDAVMQFINAPSMKPVDPPEDEPAKTDSVTFSISSL